MQINQLPPAPQKRIMLFSRELGGIFRRIVVQNKSAQKEASTATPKGGSGHGSKV